MDSVRRRASRRGARRAGLAARSAPASANDARGPGATREWLRANFVLIVMSDLRWADLVSWRSTFYKTSNLDNLACGDPKFTKWCANRVFWEGEARAEPRRPSRLGRPRRADRKIGRCIAL